MKICYSLLLCAAFCITCAVPGAFAGEKQGKLESSDLDTMWKKASYVLGYRMGDNMKNDGTSFDHNALSQGLLDGLTGSKSLYTEKQMTEIFNDFKKSEIARRQKVRKEQADKNMKEGKDFLEKMKKEKGVVATASGLLYKVIKEGTGASPGPDDEVTVNYRGTLINGKEFDSSYKRGKPITFPLNRVIPGWTEGVQLMKEGGTSRLYIPADLAYGKRGSPPRIGPNSTLVFDIELISCKKKDQKLNLKFK